MIGTCKRITFIRYRAWPVLAQTLTADQAMLLPVRGRHETPGARHCSLYARTHNLCIRAYSVYVWTSVQYNSVCLYLEVENVCCTRQHANMSCDSDNDMLIVPHKWRLICAWKVDRGASHGETSAQETTCLYDFLSFCVVMLGAHTSTRGCVRCVVG